VRLADGNLRPADRTFFATKSTGDAIGAVTVSVRHLTLSCEVANFATRPSKVALALIWSSGMSR
jgi:hypothetical protein